MTVEAWAELNRKISVMEASKTQQIQFREDHCGEWNDMREECPSWDWEHYDYRVKPVEPRRITMRPGITFLEREGEFIELTPEIRKALNL